MATRITVDLSELTCSICLEVFTDPRILPCVHSYCFGCLDGWVKKSPGNNTITCPLCKETSPVPKGGLRKVKNNYFLQDLVGRMNKKDTKPSGRGIECSTDDCVQPSVQYCTEGCGPLCNDCFRHHARSKGSKKHHVVPVDKAPDMDPIRVSELAPLYCKMHPRNIVDQFCIDCGLAACDSCLIRNHRQHKLVDLTEQAETSRKQLENIVKETDVIIKLIDEQIADSEKHTKQSSDDIHNTKQQINKVIDGMINKLNKQRKQLFTTLDQIENEKEKVVMSVRDGLDFNKAAVTSLRAYTDNVLRHGRDCDRVQQVGDIQSRLVSVNTARTPSFVWVHHDNKGTPSRGDMTVARVSIKTDVTESEAVAGSVRGAVAEAGAVSERIVTKIPMIEQVIVTGLVVMDQTLWTVHYGKSSLHAYPVTSPHQPQSSCRQGQPQTLSIQGLSRPMDMVRFPPGHSQCVISDSTFVKQELLFIKLEEGRGVWRVTSQRAVKVNYAPYGLGVRDNQLLVCGDDNVIHVLSTSGEETHRVNMPQGVTPWKAVAQLTSPGFVIRDCGNKQVVLMTEKGKIQHTHRGQEGFIPGGIVCHGHSIYVTDYDNHSVDELSVDGRHVRQLISEQGVRKPGRMCVDDTGRLYVAQGGRKYEVWVIETTATPTDTGGRLLTQQTRMEMSVTWWH